MLKRSLYLGLLALAQAGAVSAQALDQPEAATSRTAKDHQLEHPAKRFAVSAANPLAVDAGIEILQAGGSAFDAVVAVQLVLGLVEPQSSGIGGGAFLMHWDGRTVQALDGRETAPAAATPELFFAADGKPMPMGAAIRSGLSVGVPGAVAMLAEGQRMHGRLPWARLMAPAIRIAQDGFLVSPRLHGLLSGETALQKDKQAGALFYDAEGQPRPVGYLLKNPAYAAVLKRVASEGAKGFYSGPVAEDIVRRVRTHAVPGKLALSDMAAYKPVVRAPLCNDWRSYRVCGFGPPTSGHLTLMQILGLIDLQAGDAKPGQTADWLHRYAEAAKLAFADRAQFIGDPAFVTAPGGDWQNLLAPAYLKTRAALAGPMAMKPASAGQPAAVPVAWAAQSDQLEHGTSHVSVIDADGHAVSMTTSVESAFGNRVMSDGGTGLAGGFMLNNQLTDFSLAPRGADGQAIANRVEPGKRPRSSMAPTLVFERTAADQPQRLILVAGSPGGPVIIHYLAKVLTGRLAWGLAPQDAVDLPNFGHFNGASFILEKGAFAASTLDALRARGHQIVEVDLTSGLQVLARDPGGWIGAADPRREGVVRGE
jgi:gamma-glutamyltranspeptidase/glutathione hydrolase